MAATVISYSGGLAGLKKQTLYGKDQIVTVVPGATGDTGYSVALTDRLIYVPLGLAGYAFTLTLPKVDEAIGLIFSVYLGATGTVTVQDNDESADWGGDYDLDASADSITLYSNGIRWIELDNAIA